MYSPKICEDLIPLIYKNSKLEAKTMTKYIDDLIRPLLMEQENINENKNKNENDEEKTREKENDEKKIRENENGSDEGIDIYEIDKVDIEKISYCCSSCRMKVEETDGVRGVCENCEGLVFVEKK